MSLSSWQNKLNTCFMSKCSVVSHRKIIGVNLEDDDLTLDTFHTPFSIHVPTINVEDEVDNVHANHNYHDEG